MRHLALTLVSLLLSACGTCPVPKPQVVYVTVEKIVPVPTKLTAPIGDVEKRDNSCGEAVRLANARQEGLRTCNAKLHEIGVLAPEIKP
jgi:hypothetical protein